MDEHSRKPGVYYTDAGNEYLVVQHGESAVWVYPLVPADLIRAEILSGKSFDPDSVLFKAYLN